MIEKKVLRKKMMKKRSNLSISKKKLKDKSIYNQVINDQDYISADSVFLFLSFGSEINTKPIVKHALDHGKQVFLPKVVGKNLELFEIEDFENLLKFALKTVGDAAESILEGKMEAAPFRKGDEKACTFCEFSSICQFDTDLTDNTYRNLKPLSEKEALERIGKSLKISKEQNENGGGNRG